MNYTKLSKVQKRCVDAFIKIRPELETAVSITRTDVETIFAILLKNRETGGEKIGYPMWLVKGEKVGRGEYKFPAPIPSNKIYNPIPPEEKLSKSGAIRDADEDKEFFQDLQNYGIIDYQE